MFIIYFYHFLTQYNLLVENQCGFRISRSCELAVTHLTDKILTNIDNKKLNGLLLVDFKKSFDLVDH
jgi:predicted lipase